MHIKIYDQKIKNKKIHLVFFHGWGLDSNIWIYIIPLLEPYYTLHFFDFPGFGKNILQPLINFNKISTKILEKLPKKVIWIGWSMGGLLANYIGLNYPHRTHGIILITSSPCFVQKKNWPGINLLILKKIAIEMSNNYRKFLKNFWLLHVEKKTFNKDIIPSIININKIFVKPTKSAIEHGYSWLKEIDQRVNSCFIQVPLLRIYGALDNMVPAHINQKISQLYPKNYSYIISNAKHAPFFSHPKKLCNIINKFIQKFY